MRVAPARAAMALIFVLVLAESTEFLTFGLLPNLSLTANLTSDTLA